mmetsp:Transcript_54790/g.138406  ORF Transcript_54790/g.138406 Transcript_54790/m.138406 type:complete len:202 (-) Transcript_54790:1075-1680(-)
MPILNATPSSWPFNKKDKRTIEEEPTCDHSIHAPTMSPVLPNLLAYGSAFCPCTFVPSEQYPYPWKSKDEGNDIALLQPTRRAAGRRNSTSNWYRPPRITGKPFTPWLEKENSVHSATMPSACSVIDESICNGLKPQDMHVRSSSRPFQLRASVRMFGEGGTDPSASSRTAPVVTASSWQLSESSSRSTSRKCGGTYGTTG